MKHLIRNGRVVDPANKIDEISDILISGGRIEAVGKALDEKAGKTIDAKGMIVAPGFVDMHVHLREPGREDKETVRTGTRSAIRGGFTTVACMPNTEPALDNPDIIKALKEIIKKDALCKVAIVGAITIGRDGKALVDIEALKREGVVALSDDGYGLQDGDLMLAALKGCKKSLLLLMDHCEDKALAGKGVMNKGFVSTKMGLRGIPREAEFTFVERDIELAKKAQCPIHIAHVSCKESVEIIRKAKKAGIPVTAETAPHYFALTDECCATYDTNTKMNPPLRTAADVEAIKEGLADGTIDAIATDHAPHTDSEKDVEFDFAPFGIIGLETALGLSVTELVDKKILSWSALISKLSTNPAKILGIEAGNLSKGSVADIVIIEADKKYTYTGDSIVSRSKNSPFIGWQLKGRAVSVFVEGRPVMLDEEYGRV